MNFALRHKIRYPSDFPWSCAFGASNMMALGGDGGEVATVDLATGTWTESRFGYPGIVWDVQWPAGGDTFVTIGAVDRKKSNPVEVHWWDPATLEPRESLCLAGRCGDALLSPCGRFAALRAARSLAVVTLADASVWKLPLATGKCTFSRDGKFLAVALSRQRRPEIQLWNVKSQRQVAAIEVQTFAQSLLFTRDGESFLVGEEGQITVFTTRKWKPRFQFSTGYRVDAMADLCCDSRIAVYSYYDGDVPVMSFATGERFPGIPYPDRPHIFNFDPATRSLVCDNFADVEVWELTDTP